MIILKYIFACAFGLLFGWFSYDMQKAVFTAVINKLRARFSTVQQPHCARRFLGAQGQPTGSWLSLRWKLQWNRIIKWRRSNSVGPVEEIDVGHAAPEIQ